MPHAGGRPTDYNEKLLKNAQEYLDNAEDTIKDNGKLDVNLPSIEGLAYYLKISRETIYAWEKEDDKKEFSDIITQLRAKQARALINMGLSGQYNPTIVKVLLTKHGYREGIDQTTNDKDLPSPILGDFPHVQKNNSTKKDSVPNEED